MWIGSRFPGQTQAGGKGFLIAEQLYDRSPARCLPYCILQILPTHKPSFSHFTLALHLRAITLHRRTMKSIGSLIASRRPSEQQTCPNKCTNPRHKYAKTHLILIVNAFKSMIYRQISYPHPPLCSHSLRFSGPETTMCRCLPPLLLRS